MRKTLAAIFLLASSFAYAADEYKIITSAQGGGYFVHARIIAKYLQKQTGSIVIVHVVPGASGVVAMNYMANVAKKDGSEIGHIDTKSFMQVFMNDPQVKYDLSKFKWIGAATDGRRVPFVLFARKDKPLIIGSESSLFKTPAKLVKETTKIKADEISGYSDSAAVRLAFERNEITGAIYNLNGVKTATPHWLTDPTIEMVMQIGPGNSRSTLLPNVPTIQELAKNEDAKKLASFYEALTTVNRPFLIPPDAPKEKLVALRKVFGAILSDPEYIEDASKIGVEVTPIHWKETQEIMESLVRYPQEVVVQFRGF